MEQSGHEVAATIALDLARCRHLLGDLACIHDDATGPSSMVSGADLGITFKWCSHPIGQVEELAHQLLLERAERMNLVAQHEELKSLMRWVDHGPLRMRKP